VLPDGVSLSLPVGEMLGLIGPNGAGKPTLLRLPEGLAPSDADGVMLLGRRMEDRALDEASGTRRERVRMPMGNRWSSPSQVCRRAKADRAVQADRSGKRRPSRPFLGSRPLAGDGPGRNHGSIGRWNARFRHEVL
jgi:ABC-type phosphate/phosphonate transport system ATPase subunit